MIDPPINGDAAELERLRFALQSAQIGTWTLDIARQQVWWDTQCKDLYGFDQDDIIPFEQVIAHIHEADRQRVETAIGEALTPRSGGHYDVQFRTVGAQDGQVRWLHCRGRAEFDANGVAYRFAGTAQDITQPVRTQQLLGASEGRFKDLVTATPAATAIFVGRQMLIHQVNAPMLALWGKDESVLGKTLHAALPELEGQPFLAQLQHVFDTGEPFSHAEGMAQLIENGRPKTVYFNHAYNPLYDHNGCIYGVINTAIDVTQQVSFRQSLNESQAIRQAMIEVAELGTYSIDLAADRVVNSPRVAAWHGLSEVTDMATFISRVQPSDQERVNQVLATALAPLSTGTYEVEYVVINPQTKQRHVLQTVGQVRRELEGRPTHVDGLVRDITIQHQRQQALQQQVQQRTQELAAANNELIRINEELLAVNQEVAAANEEYTVINQELTEANGLLVRSNDNLQQFTYIASHDLQEPLRKIQQFGDLLVKQYREPLGEGVAYLERMQLAAARMSNLIKDLLSFSRISTQRNTTEPVSLQEVVSTVVDVLDFAILETKAQVQVDALPIVFGDAVQLGQLIQNLLSNALKFTQPGIAPVIRLSSQRVSADTLPPEVKPARRAGYYERIEMTDNGIGFDEKYLDRIFQVFQRLHGKGQYQGTGVGLAICEKVVANHGGVITATSQPGRGATFVIYLPV